MVFKNLLSIFVLAILASCVPQSGGGGKSLRQSASVGTTATPTPASGVLVNTSQLYWSTASVTGQVITMNANTLTGFYLRGKDVENFLSSSTTFNAIYCLEFNFSTPAKTLRSRLVPTTINNLSTGLIEKLFRVEIENETQSQFACKDLVVNPNVVFAGTQVCTTCQTTQTTSSVKLYKSNGTSIGSIVASSGNSSLNISALTFKLDPINNATSNAGTCTDNQCKNQGYDCCLSGQCIKDGSVKPSALTDTNFTNLVSQLVNNQFSSYTSWPQYYYVCPKLPDPLPTPVPTATVDPTVTALSNLNSLKNDFYCIKELTAKAAFAPFNLNDFSSTTFSAPLCTGTQTQIDTCLQTYRQNFSTSGYMCNATTTLNYLTVMKRLYSICGCSATDWTLALSNPSHPVNVCPNYYLKAVDISNTSTSTDAQIVSVQCVFPDPSPVVTPFQNLSVNLPARSAPHRFFKSSDGSALDTMVGLTTPGITAEGTEFKYLDPGTYIMPVNSSFNMNSILGQFNVDLSQAFPAKTVTLEYDSTYVISTLSGYYTPCPSCMRDSWFSAFTAHPTSQDGTGLQTLGFSTDRETYSSNNYNGNYEDTHFGRACFIPPTMIPFSHKKNTSTATQRQNRLSTQAAYYMNGYQRDWFGFNRGAVIGSFDGVTWFAIGKGRRVRATSSKLFLAINAPFADLAAPASMIVSVRQDEGIATAAEYDYDYTLTPNDYKQNEAATCQRWHSCTKDSDCIGKLGWEYVCADIASLKTLWPKFNSSAEETANVEQTMSITQILQGGAISGSSTKRCVYRGAGAPCSTSYASATSVNNRKLQSCAPNFYCASQGSGNFNTEIARFATAIENIPLALNHLYGQDSNIIGRPLHYYSASGSLTTDIKSAITANTALMSYSGSSGLCRPGRDVTSNDLSSIQQIKDASGRVDYINQVGGCSSSILATGIAAGLPVSKIYACPIVDPVTGNYAQFLSNTTSQGASLAALTLSLTQNTCGKEAQSSTAVSPFLSIEGKSLSTTTVMNKTLVENACLRRAGAVCHTDLDCSPNHMHSDVAGNYSIAAYFGGTLAEQKYWQEYLVCGQDTEKPTASDAKYFEYDMGKNRCCREIGKDMTLYTAGDPLNESLSSTLTTGAVSFNSPSTSGRYSRYTILPGYPNATYPPPSISTLLTAGQKQWKTIGETAQKTCCGGSWIRKFADGTHKWPIGTRNNFDLTNFKCLNYSLSSAVSKPADVPSPNYSADYDLYCIGTTASYNCAQTAYAANTGNQIVSPTLWGFFTSAAYELFNPPTYNWGGITEIAKLWTNYAEHGYVTGAGIAIKEHMLFTPVYYSYTDWASNKPSGWKQPYFGNSSDGDTVTFYVPSYIYDNVVGGSSRGIGAIYLISNSGWQCALNSNLADTNIGGYVSAGNTKDCWDGWGLSNDNARWSNYLGSAVSGNRIRCNENGAANPDPCQWSYNATTGTVTVSRDFDWSAVSNGPVNIMIEYDTTQQRQGGRPGNDLYYLNKLGKMELNGIPQVLQEPLYCTSDRNKLVPDLYKGTSRTWVQNNDINDTANLIVNTTANPDALNATDKSLLTSSMLNNSAVFSNNEMTCCLKLGQDSLTAASCCSGFIKNDKCTLPTKTDLNVYFNRYVSGEGVDPDGPAILADSDFDTYTGEPSTSATTLNKLQALGNKYCDGEKTRAGGAFGDFDAEPISPSEPAIKMYSITDSYNDIDTDNTPERGVNAFTDGYRWNHHVYCDE